MKRLHRPSPALAVGILALVLGTTGTAVGAAMISGAQIKNSSITGLDIRNKSLTAADFAGSVRGPQGIRGPQGPQGAQGPQGPAGAPATQPTIGYKVVNASGTVPQDQIVHVTATCPPGTVVSGGGLGIGANDLVYANSAGQSFEVSVYNGSSIANASASAQAFCISGTVAAARRSVQPSLSLDERRALEADVLRRDGD